MSGGQRTAYRVWFSPFIMWVLGTELGPSDLAARAFTCGAISPALFKKQPLFQSQPQALHTLDKNFASLGSPSTLACCFPGSCWNIHCCRRCTGWVSLYTPAAFPSVTFQSLDEIRFRAIQVLPPQGCKTPVYL